jgi:two-component system NtrC family response regulator
MADSRRITCEDLEIPSPAAGGEARHSAVAGTTADGSLAGGLKEARESLERELVNQALERTDGNISAAAKELGVSRPTFYELMNKLGISKD